MKKTRLGIMVGLIAFGLAASLFAAVIGEEDIGVSGEQDLNIRVSEDGEQPKEPQYAPGEVLVKFKEGVNPIRNVSLKYMISPIIMQAGRRGVVVQ
jgi:hypothetical protein